MFGLRKAFVTFAFILICVPLAGCESIDSAMTSVRDGISSLNFPAPRTEPPQTAFREEDNRTASTMKQGVKISSRGDCPQISIVEDLNALHQFTNPDRPTPEGRISSIVFKELQTGCSYNENNVVVELELVFEGQLGPRARIWATDRPSFAYPYFIAITTPNGNIAAKEVFAATVSYDREHDAVTHRESMRQIIPLQGEYGTDYEILVGFQLTEGELAYNRSLRESGMNGAGVSERYIEPRPAAKPAAAELIKVVPARKPPAPATQPEPPPEPEPEPVPEPEPAAAAEPEARESQTVTITEEEEIIVIEEPVEETVPGTVEESTEGESAILEEDAIIDSESTVDPVEEEPLVTVPALPETE